MNYNIENGNNSAISVKIQSFLYNQMLEIITRYPGEVKADDYIKWLTKQSEKVISSESEK